MFRPFARIALAPALAMVLSVALLPPPAAAWGNSGHSFINADAAAKIPADMPAFLRTKSAIARIAYLGPEPDRWRGAAEYALNQSQAPDHFIDLERVFDLGLKDLGDLPRGRYEFIKLLYAKRAATKIDPDNYLPERVGFQPYITMEVFDRLKAAFRDYRALKATNQPAEPVQQDIVFYAGWLGHYVADGSMPLHTSIQYDGWTGANPNGYATQKGIHAQFETTFVDANLTASSFAAMIHAPQKLDDPFHGYLNYLADSHKLVERVYQLDKSHALDASGTPESRQFVKQRLAAGAQMLLNLWYTAWLDSAQ